jgi:hypothetical protein
MAKRRTDSTMAKRRRTDNTMAKRRKTDNTMTKRRTDNTMAKRRRTDNTMAKRRKTDNTMAKRVLSVFLLLAIVSSVLLRFTDSDFPFGIFKLILDAYLHWTILFNLNRS